MSKHRKSIGRWQVASYGVLALIVASIVTSTYSAITGNSLGLIGDDNLTAFGRIASGFFAAVAAWYGVMIVKGIKDFRELDNVLAEEEDADDESDGVFDWERS